MANSQVLERAKVILTTGEWWAVPWWRADEYYDDRLFTRRQAEDAFTQLKKIFNAKWMLEQRDIVITEAKKWLGEHEQEVKQNSWFFTLKEKLDITLEPSEAYSIYRSMGFRATHPLFDYFFTEGLIPFQYMVSLGLNLFTAVKANLLGYIAERLKNSSDYSGAHFELEILSHLILRGYSVERDPPSGTKKKKGDLKVSKESETVFIEVKRLHPSLTNVSVSTMTNLIFCDVLSDPRISEIANILHLELSNDLVDMAKTKKGKGLTPILDSWQAISKQIRDHIMERLQKKEWGHHIVPGLAVYDLSQGKESDIRMTGGFNGLPLSQKAEIRKFFRNALKDALEQLPVTGPGVLIISIPLSLGPDMVQQIVLSRIRKSRQRYQHLSAIIFVHTFFREKFLYQFIVVKNPHAAIDVSNYAVVKDILLLKDSWN